jgi:MFS family permease
VGSTLGRLALGGVADRLGRRHSMIVAALGMATMLLWWLAARDALGLAVFAGVFGLFYGTFVALIPALTTDYFGGRSAGAVIGLLYTSVGLGSLIGPTVAGLAYDLGNSYAPAILLTAAGNLLAVVCLLLLPDAQRWRAATSQAPATAGGRVGGA